MKLFEETLREIYPGDKGAEKKAWDRLNGLTKPIGSLGELEDIAAKFAGITGKVFNEIEKKNIVIMCGDNGVVEEGVSSCPQDLTYIVTNNFTRGITGVNVLAKFYKSDITVVDVGVKKKIDNPKVIDKRVMEGTNNIVKGPAMTREQCIEAIEAGIDMVEKLVKSGYSILGTGEMGIGNTTTSAAIISAITGLSVEKTVGKGSALTAEAFENKKRVIQKALDVNKPNEKDIIDVISKVGGLDIAGLCGAFLGAARYKVPIVIDGIIASAAALCAYKLNENVKDYMFPSHLSAEPGAIYVMEEIGLTPMLNLRMRLGEGSGCPIAFSIIESALYTICNMGTFDDANIVTDYLLDYEGNKVIN